MAATAYPLTWPPGFPRTPRERRHHSKFRTNYDNALKNVRKSLVAFAQESGKQLTDPIMSSNIDLMGRLKDNDPGIAVWFTWDGMQVSIPVDRYLSPAENLQAIHHIIEARRVELRHGTLALVRATFTGFKALPAPAGKHWRDILKITGPVTKETIGAAYRERAGEAHPDKPGGSTEKMAELSAARDAALKELGG